LFAGTITRWVDVKVIVCRLLGHPKATPKTLRANPYTMFSEALEPRYKWLVPEVIAMGAELLRELRINLGRKSGTYVEGTQLFMSILAIHFNRSFRCDSWNLNIDPVSGREYGFYRFTCYPEENSWSDGANKMVTLGYNMNLTHNGHWVTLVEEPHS
jgi:hypothetical protein